MHRISMNRNIFLALIALILVSSVTFAADNSVPKESYLSVAQERLPASFCSEGTYFRSCYSVTEAECKAVTTEATTACIKQYGSEMPARLVHPQDTAGWGAKLGTCVGTSFETKLEGKLLSKENCRAKSAK